MSSYDDKNFEPVTSSTKKEDNEMMMALDDTSRVKVLSPGMLVFRRFIRNKLAIVGSVILIFMFAFTFIGGMISPYSQKEVFHKYDKLVTDYAYAEFRTTFSNFVIGNNDIPSEITSKINTSISQFTEEQESMILYDSTDTAEYNLVKLGKSCYSLKKIAYIDIANYNNRFKTYEFDNNDYDNAVFKTNFLSALNRQENEFIYNDNTFKIISTRMVTYIKMKDNPNDVMFATNMVFDNAEGNNISAELKILALNNLYTTKAFIYDNIHYSIEGDEERYSIYESSNEDKVLVANITHFIARRFNGEDTLSIDYKEALRNVIVEMDEKSMIDYDFDYEQDGKVINYLVNRKNNNFVVRSEEIKYLIDIHAGPSTAHWLGTDSNGMDVLTRMMYGGRISLLIGFVVIIIELLIGVILGGIAGFFGKWIDNIIMRLVDIFNCIPFLPIMMIIGAIFDKMQMDPYTRIMWMMVVMGILGWSGIARLVRGQILSLREQEFMIAAEATGLSVGRRIFKHLIPNVMPQLIVNATMGLGSIILIESTLSFLGLGVKYPMATWGAMIYSVSTASDLVKYTYIWIPVGLLICLTVIAFNFVGDGLRDAYDPKMKR